MKAGTSIMTPLIVGLLVFVSSLISLRISISVAIIEYALDSNQYTYYPLWKRKQVVSCAYAGNRNSPTWFCFWI